MSPSRHVPCLPRRRLSPLARTTRAALLAPLFAALFARCTDAPQPTGPAAPRGLRPSMASVAAATNGKIAFWSVRDGNGEIYVMNADGSGQRNITSGPGNNTQAAWSRDGAKLAFISDRDGNQEIYVMNADGTAQTRVTNTPGFEQFPAWSPDGTKLAFTTYRDGNAEIYIMNADGTAQTNRTNNPAFDCCPTWSPDGAKVAFRSDRDGQEIYVMNADGTAPTKLTTTPSLDDLPAWSPDGTKIAFASNREGPLRIYVMNADGSEQTRITNGPNLDFFPTWSPDGTKLALTSDRDGNFEIYVVNVDGSGLTNITNNPALDFQPSWVFGVSDLEPPVLTVPSNITVEATSPAGAILTYSASATDNVDPAPAVSCDTPSGATFPLGSTVVTCTATDAAGNTATASFFVTIVDTTAPALSLPPAFAVDATSPSGAVVSYTVTASDAVSIPTVSCSPASGSIFAIGTHTVSCTATDAAGNSTAAAFVVTVKGATEQIGDLQGAVTDLHLPQGTETSIKQKLTAAATALALGDRDGACDSLQSLISHVNAQSGKKISAADAAVLIAEAERIRAVLEC